MYRQKGKNERPLPDVNECAAKKLSRKSMSRHELEKYLIQRGYEKEDAEGAVKTLVDLGYLDDSVFAAEFLAYDIGRGRSRKKAFFDLKQKGVSAENIDKGYEKYVEEYGEPDEYETAKSEAEKVLLAAGIETGDEITDKISGRIARRLYTRGFSNSLIFEVLGDLKNTF